MVPEESTSNTGSWLFGVHTAGWKEVSGVFDDVIEFILDSGTEANVVRREDAAVLQLLLRRKDTPLCGVNGGRSVTGCCAVIQGFATDDLPGSEITMEMGCHVGDVRKSVLAVSRMVDKMMTANFYAHRGEISRDGKSVWFPRRAGLYVLSLRRPRAKQR